MVKANFELPQIVLLVLRVVAERAVLHNHLPTSQFEFHAFVAQKRCYIRRPQLNMFRDKCAVFSICLIHCDLRDIPRKTCDEGISRSVESVRAFQQAGYHVQFTLLRLYKEGAKTVVLKSLKTTSHHLYCSDPLLQVLRMPVA